ncbi:uncharacterized protein LOC121405497 isoform X2 [Drosophila obscura]|uniref:uncharacterized protein LOC121405497 isoform X2 n=1 Tax=Drosophila obscura TaxID=7282 RepID=UPI001BB22A2E|nr:uncharacterized protein LOC121405497 isoform X2 [Drosophila obscura]
MDFFGRKNDSERLTPLENSEKEFISGQAESERNVSLVEEHEDEDEDVQKSMSGLSPLVDIIRKLSKLSRTNEALSMDLSTGTLTKRMPINRQIEYEPQNSGNNMTDLGQLGGEQPKETANNQHQGGWHYVLHVPTDGESPNIDKPVQYESPLPHPSHPSYLGVTVVGWEQETNLPAGYDLSSMQEIEGTIWLDLNGCAFLRTNQNQTEIIFVYQSSFDAYWRTVSLFKKKHRKLRCFITNIDAAPAPHRRPFWIRKTTEV